MTVSSVDLAGKNRFEMLVFGIGNGSFGLNVFKIREIIGAQRIYSLPKSHDNVMGVITIRGTTMPVIDLRKVLNIKENSDSEGFFVVTEYNRKVQALKIDSINKIENISWKDVKKPPSMGGRGSYLTSVVNVEDKLIQILDVERIIGEINGEEDVEITDSNFGINKRVLVVDDSLMARNQMGRCLSSMGFDVDYKNDGQEALDYLVSLKEQGVNLSDKYDVMVSDIEMPNMDGYTLVTELRHRGCDSLKIIMHSSMSGVFNQAMVNRIGADRFIAKFKAEDIQKAVVELISDTKMAA